MAIEIDQTGSISEIWSKSDLQRWDNAVAHVCTLKVNTKGNVLYWRGQDTKYSGNKHRGTLIYPVWPFLNYNDQSNGRLHQVLTDAQYLKYLSSIVKYTARSDGDSDCLEINIIKDVRTGRAARLPKDSKLRNSLDMGGNNEESLEDKSVTVVYGYNMVDIFFITFVSNSAKVAKDWTTNLFALCHNLLALNAPPISVLEVQYNKLVCKTVGEGKISVKDFAKIYCNHKDDKKRVTDALAAVGLPSNIKTIVDVVTLILKYYKFHCSGAKKKPYLTLQQFVDFLNKDQRDPRLNEIIYPYVDEKRGQEIISKFETKKEFYSKGQLSLDGFTRYLMSEDNAIIPLESLDIYQDPNQPLSSYFINSSHNTYLSGHQFTGKSSVEMYRQVLIAGCRCIELDCWDGKGDDQEPIITHGFTMCTDISFKDVMYAIADSAFKTSDYPVILSFENHCTTKQQQKLAQYCKTIFGDMLLNKILDDYPLEPGKPLPPPSALYRKIIIKNKKLTEDMVAYVEKQPSVDVPDQQQQSNEAANAADTDKPQAPPATTSAENDGNPEEETDGESEAEEEAPVNQQVTRMKQKKVKKKRNDENTCCKELSDLVNYVTPVHFPGFEKADNLPMQLNNGKFEFNGRCGFLLKPDFMRKKDRNFDPFAESTVDGIVAGKLSIKILSGQLLTEKRIGTYIEVEMYGLPVDTVRKRYRTKLVPNNGINPFYDEEPFVFKKIVLPQLALLKIGIHEESGKLIGQRVLPVEVLRAGYRQIQLRSESNMLVNAATIFVKIDVNDYVPGGLADFAAALADPINFQSAVEKRTEQLAELMDEDDAQGETNNGKSSVKQDSQSKFNPPHNPPQSRNPVTPHSHDKTNPPQPVPKKISSDGNGTKIQGQTNHVEPEPTMERNYDLVVVENKKTFKKQQSLNEQEARAVMKKHLKSKSTLAKVHNENLSKLRQNESPISPKNNKPTGSQVNNITWLENEQKSEMQKLLLCQVEAFYELRMKHLKTEFDIKEKLLEKYEISSKKKLQQAHEKEECSMKKYLAVRTKEEIKTVSKTTTDKHELRSLKSEVRRKMVEDAVQETHKLKNKQEKEIADLESRFQELAEELGNERKKEEKSIKDEYETQRQEIIRDEG
ncbi:uncharacterized protein TRIADDRAFT_61893 [Trichoplax adhaerens]|uniref:1-phosphatidylinositol 4,5-bisphosphate phosphodiesterase n=1 Tax=Trichoplax adhaerens TaxID=10228 RepID=B3SC96_TRIAD|nr:hypothetical protein TRIADDRAFT_61893 [Trichoplax adhaerens]EDV19641.1 hypothetical protein TRIADDRAFT_61893 [Trichoplax adhaerens]|eukprot:XP_002117879.1 hypothetical protein TRIADDRAFT_61893 [Trichoplax adhaerens]